MNRQVDLDAVDGDIWSARNVEIRRKLFADLLTRRPNHLFSHFRVQPGYSNRFHFLYYGFLLAYAIVAVLYLVWVPMAISRLWSVHADIEASAASSIRSSFPKQPQLYKSGNGSLYLASFQLTATPTTSSDTLVTVFLHTALIAMSVVWYLVPRVLKPKSSTPPEPTQ